MYDVHFDVVLDTNCAQHIVCIVILQLLCTMSLVWMILYTHVTLLYIGTTYVRHCHCFEWQRLSSRSLSSQMIDWFQFFPTYVPYAIGLDGIEHICILGMAGEGLSNLLSVFGTGPSVLDALLHWLFFSLYHFYFRLLNPQICTQCSF